MIQHEETRYQLLDIPGSTTCQVIQIYINKQKYKSIPKSIDIDSLLESSRSSKVLCMTDLFFTDDWMLK